jgi:hypothetical protein
VRVRAATMVEGGAGRRKSDSGGEWLERCVDDGIVESGEDLESGGDLESFGMKSETTRGGLLFIGSKISVAIVN